MKQPKKRVIYFHGKYKEMFQDKPLEIYADSMFNLFNILIKCNYPLLSKEKEMQIAFESEDGQFTDLFDPEQSLDSTQTKVHIFPNPDGAEFGYVVFQIIMAIIAVGVSLLLAPKTDLDQDTASGSNFSTAENVVGQGGVIPVVLGELRVGSRVASYGIDSKVKRGYY